MRCIHREDCFVVWPECLRAACCIILTPSCLFCCSVFLDMRKNRLARQQACCFREGAGRWAVDRAQAGERVGREEQPAQPPMPHRRMWGDVTCFLCSFAHVTQDMHPFWHKVVMRVCLRLPGCVYMATVIYHMSSYQSSTDMT